MSEIYEPLSKSFVTNTFPKVIVQERPKELASDHSSTEDVIHYFIDNNDCDHIILLQATSPLTRSHQIISALDLYFKNDCRPLVSGTRQHCFLWNNDGNPINYRPTNRPRRQDWEGTFVENGAIYIFKKQEFLDFKTRCKEPCTLFEMDYLTSIELDSKSDWNLLEYLVKTKSLNN